MASEKQKVTLYDFLYIDRERIKSFYAQLFGGLQTAVQQVESSSQTDKNAFEASAAKLITLGTEGSKTVSESRLENLDPHDLLLRDVLQELAERDMVTGDPNVAKAGSLVLLSGRVTIFDLQSVRPFFGMFADLLALGKIETPDWAGKNKDERKRNIALLTKYLEASPLGLQVIFETPETSLWGTLNASNLRESVGDLGLKHGPTLSETWHMLAVVDVVGAPSSVKPEGLSDVLSGLLQANADMLRLLGKPADKIGVTPLLIFRKLE